MKKYKDESNFKLLCSSLELARAINTLYDEYYSSLSGNEVCCQFRKALRVFKL